MFFTSTKYYVRQLLLPGWSAAFKSCGPGTSENTPELTVLLQCFNKAEPVLCAQPSRLISKLNRNNVRCMECAKRLLSCPLTTTYVRHLKSVKRQGYLVTTSKEVCPGRQH